MPIALRTSPVGTDFAYVDLISQTSAVWGGIAWPGDDREGCAIVVAAGTFQHREGYELYVLDEFKSFDVREIVRQCVSMDDRYWVSWKRPDQSYEPSGRWIGDETHDAAGEFLREANDEFRSAARLSRGLTPPRRLRLTHTALLEKKQVYHYILPRLKSWLQKDRQILYLKDSQLGLHLGAFDSIDQSDTAGLKLGHDPAIEALGFVTCELQQYLKRQGQAHREHWTGDDGVTGLLEY